MSMVESSKNNYQCLSMTAFGRSEGESALGSFAWELRTVNHRYLDVIPKLPENFRYLEVEVRDVIRSRLSRGKCEVVLTLQKTAAEQEMRVDTDVLSRLLKVAEQVRQQAADAAPLSTQQLISYPGVLVGQNVDRDAVTSVLLQGLDGALKQLLDGRRDEGKKMAAVIDERLVSILDLVSSLEKDLPAIISAHKDKLMAKLAELGVELDEDRLSQEVVLVAQRLDVAEELDRLTTHVDAVRSAMSKKGPCGRRLDFLMQELNREANTLGSKAGSIENSNAAIDLKVLIEQMREQVQNIE